MGDIENILGEKAANDLGLGLAGCFYNPDP
jgi:hypothetical protein